MSPTPRADVAEELTYAAEANGIPVTILCPCRCENPQWPLRDDSVNEVGVGTTYVGPDGEELFFHNFCSRYEHTHQGFLDECDRVLGLQAMPGYGA